MKPESQSTISGKDNPPASISTRTGYQTRTISFQVNGETRDVTADPSMPLLWVLRDVLNLTGTKFSCGIGVCGSCTVHLDGEAVRSCVTPVSDAEGKEVVTIEGLAQDGSHPLQKAWEEENVSQCGYCQPGQIMTAASLLEKNPQPSEEEIKQHMAGTLCRCGTHLRIHRAVQKAAEEKS